MKHALLSVIVALRCLKVRCWVSPVRSAVNGLWICCAFIPALFLAPGLAFTETQTSNSTLTLCSFIDKSMHRRWKHSNTQLQRLYSVFLHPLATPSLLSSLQEKGNHFLWLFRLWHQHLFPTSCYCLPAQEVHHKSQEKPQPGSSCVRWWRGGSVKHSWQEREIIQIHPKISLEK